MSDAEKRLESLRSFMFEISPKIYTVGSGRVTMSLIVNTKDAKIDTQLHRRILLERPLGHLHVHVLCFFFLNFDFFHINIHYY